MLTSRNEHFLSPVVEHMLGHCDVSLSGLKQLLQKWWYLNCSLAKCLRRRYGVEKHRFGVGQWSLISFSKSASPSSVRLCFVLNCIIKIPLDSRDSLDPLYKGHCRAVYFSSVFTEFKVLYFFSFIYVLFFIFF